MTRPSIACAVVTWIAIGMLGPSVVIAGEAGSTVGTWIHNKRESIGMPDPDESQTVEIRSDDPVLDYTWTGVTADGKTSTFSYAMPADGKRRALPGGEGLEGVMRRTPSGVVEATLFFPDGAKEEKYCMLTTATRLSCFATYVDAKGGVSLFKQIFDRKS